MSCALSVTSPPLLPASWKREVVINHQIKEGEKRKLRRSSHQEVAGFQNKIASTHNKAPAMIIAMGSSTNGKPLRDSGIDLLIFRVVNFDDVTKTDSKQVSD